MLHKKKKTSLLRILKCAFCCVLFVWIMFWCVLLFGHHVLCPFHIGLCTPFVYWLKRMPMQYDALAFDDNNSIDIEWNKANANLSCNLASDRFENAVFVDLEKGKHEQDPTYLALSVNEQNKLRDDYLNIEPTKQSSIKKLIVIGIPHGGTTWFATKVLNQHPSISMHGELLFGWSTSYCNAHFMFNDDTRCTWNTLKAIMETYFTQQTIKRAKHHDENDNYYVGFKITLWQIMPTMYGEFVRWIYCNHVTVIQLIRSASINSFYSQQAETIEMIFYGRKFQTQTNQKHVLPQNETFDLDAKYAKKFVESTEYWQKILFQLLKFHRKSIHFLVLYYEDLVSEYKLNHLNGVQSFLQVPYDEDVFRKKRYSIARLHSTPCHMKIRNWHKSIKHNLIDTDSYYACEKDNS